MVMVKDYVHQLSVKSYLTLNSSSVLFFLLSNDGTGESNHRHCTRTGLPRSVSWKRFVDNNPLSYLPAAHTCSILALDARKLQLRPPSRAGLGWVPGLGDRCRMEMEGALAREKELLEGKEVKGSRSLRGEAGELLGAGATLSSNTMSVMEAGEVDLQLQ